METARYSPLVTEDVLHSRSLPACAVFQAGEKVQQRTAPTSEFTDKTKPLLYGAGQQLTSFTAKWAKIRTE